MFSNILVPLDGSALAERAVPVAEWLAKKGVRLRRPLPGALVPARSVLLNVVALPAYGVYGDAAALSRPELEPLQQGKSAIPVQVSGAKSGTHHAAGALWK